MKIKNSELKIYHNSDTNLVTSAAIEAINDSLQRNKRNSILFLVSGGSALPLLDEIKSDFLGPHITISVLDERYSEDLSINNFAQLIQTNFYQSALEKECEFIDTRPKDETLEELAERFDASLKLWKKNNHQGVVIATQGIGPDGHTSGIMPFPEDPKAFHTLFEQEDIWVVGYDAGGKNQYPLRVTTTIPFLRNQIDEAIIYAGGGNKRAALENVFLNGQLSETPARVIKEMKHISLFTTVMIQ
ncbi:MAG TPA: 6-phosphogluconolactonase [Candidatus Nitrosocosmicus sp.]|nr:6-phosphogluconolactonase [Candidatus Nitrosocosmicus sp.]